jgi:hypothetical protein
MVGGIMNDFNWVRKILSGRMILTVIAGTCLGLFSVTTCFALIWLVITGKLKAESAMALFAGLVPLIGAAIHWYFHRRDRKIEQ